MKALETIWQGYRFRSRTEARWAVALSHAKIEFEYERQGFDLPSGWYLPDFWLPESRTWLEIKGEAPNERELALAMDMAEAGEYMLIAVGPPDPKRIHLLNLDPDGSQYEALFELPAAAYRAARAERFDGKPSPEDQRRAEKLRRALRGY